MTAPEIRYEPELATPVLPTITPIDESPDPPIPPGHHPLARFGGFLPNRGRFWREER